jgi:hypothetical protein
MSESYHNMGSVQEDATSAHDEGNEPEEKMEGETALLPKSILAGKEFNVGDEVVLKIVKMDGDEIHVQYAPEKPKGDGEEGGEGESEMSQAESRMGAMTNGARGGMGGY